MDRLGNSGNNTMHSTREYLSVTPTTTTNTSANSNASSSMGNTTSNPSRSNKGASNYGIAQDTPPEELEEYDHQNVRSKDRASAKALEISHHGSALPGGHSSIKVSMKSSTKPKVVTTAVDLSKCK